MPLFRCVRRNGVEPQTVFSPEEAEQITAKYRRYLRSPIMDYPKVKIDLDNLISEQRKYSEEQKQATLAERAKHIEQIKKRFGWYDESNWTKLHNEYYRAKTILLPDYEYAARNGDAEKERAAFTKAAKRILELREMLPISHGADPYPVFWNEKQWR
ncbi:hypothetical protein MMIC_P2480 [Mariprofundus micogutta]|uniref:Uncharacterized protein n=1 Tax=Mariprofundus micogutta TaxID=1921010 RepID=A0A1L8CRD0_9PROT|nr:hypothetical protein [Mariprofundus micogutta]GAV21485.1 hypothetical protein MMIC_P2480 [Mariprofundus micogutta]